MKVCVEDVATIRLKSDTKSQASEVMRMNATTLLIRTILEKK